MVARCLVALLALIAVGSAAAQTPLDPAVSVSIDLPPGPSSMALGSQTNVTFTVSVEVDNILCTADDVITVTLAVAEEGGPVNGITAGLSVTSIEVPVTTGPHSSHGGAAAGGSADAVLQLAVSPSAPGNHDHAFNVTATFGSAGSCQAVATPPSASASALHGLRTGPAPVEAAAATGQDGAAPQEVDGKDSPGLAVPVLLGVLAAVGVARRRL